MAVKIMGIINLSPESFFKGSIKQEYEEIVNTAKQMEKQGADIIDLGGMSTAPYLNTLISVEEEIERIKKGIKAIREASNILISVDTPRAKVAREALRLGADIINDITGLKYDNDMANTIKEYNASVLISAYSKEIVKGDIKDTIRLLKESILIAKDHGIDDNKIIIDPAIGFFRTQGNNPFFTRINYEWFVRDLAIIRDLKDLKILNKPICISISRKSFIGKVLDLKDPNERLYGSIAAEAISVMNGADIIRTHNVYDTLQSIKIAEAIKSVNYE
jgi:dihydropteroate synthase